MSSSPSGGSTDAVSAGRITGPRLGLLIGFAVMLIALLSVFGYVLINSESQSRHQAEQRFAAEAKITAGFTSALLETSVSSSEAADAKTLGAAVIPTRVLDTLSKTSGLAYVFVLNQQGQVIAASSGAPASIHSPATAALPHIRRALTGTSTLSNILPPLAHGHSPILQWAVPFNTAYGRRVEVEALDTPVLFTFLDSLLSQTRAAGNGVAFILDSTGGIVAVAGETLTAGTHPKAASLLRALSTKASGTYGYGGVEHYFASTPVGGSTWRVVLTINTSQLYPALSGSRSWILYTVLAAFALLGLASLLLFRRALRSAMELRWANSELTEMNSDLEQRVAQRTATVEERAKELARSNAELEQFSSVASHDLQEPLRKIRMYGDRLRGRVGDSLGEEANSDLERMESAAARMQKLINDLLDFSRVTQRGKDFERVDLAQVTEEVVSDLEARILELGARVEVGELPVIDADRTQMRQLVQNLIGNALKFHRPQQTPLVRISSEVIAGQQPRFPGESGAGERCVITVQDNGIGFEEKHAERVFAAFERLHSRSAYEGTGIGLSIARKIVWRHGGHIAAKGVINQGATFTVTLPLSQLNGSAMKEEAP
ncbi:MAG: sensor histidine kinase [Solirubrobacteraceae bacterium]